MGALTMTTIAVMTCFNFIVQGFLQILSFQPTSDPTVDWAFQLAANESSEMRMHGYGD